MDSMRVTFKSTRQHRYCQYFIKSLGLMAAFDFKAARSFYFHISTKEIKIATSIQDIHRGMVEKSCTMIIKKEVYSLSGQDKEIKLGKMYRIPVARMMKAFAGSATRIVQINLQMDRTKLEMNFNTEHNQFQCVLKVAIQQYQTEYWPQHYQSTRDNSYELINLATLQDKQLLYYRNLEQKQLYVDIGEKGLCIKTMEQGIAKREEKIVLKQIEAEKANYNFLQIKYKLKNKLSLCLKSRVLFNHFHFCLKKKTQTQFKIINVYDKFKEDVLKLSYLFMRAKLQYGQITKVVNCIIFEDASEVEVVKPKQPKKQRQGNRRNALLKTEENPRQIKKIVMSRFNSIGEEGFRAEERFYQKQPYGKIEEGEETFTRKFRHFKD